MQTLASIILWLEVLLILIVFMTSSGSVEDKNNSSHPHELNPIDNFIAKLLYGRSKSFYSIVLDIAYEFVLQGDCATCVGSFGRWNTPLYPHHDSHLQSK
jgi:hypothetical protein